MRLGMKRCVAGIAVVATLLWGSAVAAQGILVQLSGGLKVGPNLNLLSEPSEERIDLPVPGFAGFGWGIGLALEALYGDFVGLEVDLLYAQTSGKGEITFYHMLDVEERLSSTELQVPILLRLQYPSHRVKPFLTVGCSFVVQLDSEFTIDQTFLVNPVDTSIETESYVMLAVGLGAILDLGAVRVPFEFRGQYRPLDDDPAERVVWQPELGGVLTHLGVRSTWEGQIWFLTGAMYSLGL